MYRIQVFGILNYVDYQMALCCAEDLHVKSPNLFAVPQLEGMVEMEWDNFIENKIKELKGELWSFEDKALVFVNGEVVGGPKEFITWAEEKDCYENFRPIALYEVLAEESYRNFIESKKHTFIFMDFAIEKHSIGRVVIELFDDLVPRTCMNFRMLCTGELGFTQESEVNLHYKNSIIHRIVPQGWIQGGDIKAQKGNDGTSIYGDTFEDENFIVKHNKRGILGMANKGPHTNSSQFYITLQPACWMDGKFVAFGQVIEGSRTLKVIEGQPTQNDRPIRTITIVDIGLCVVGEQ